MESYDGTIIPSFLNQTDSGWIDNYQDYALRLGHIVAIHLPNDDTNFNKKSVEYDVEVLYANGDGGYAPVVYPRMIVASVFGGIADRIQWTPRKEDYNDKTQEGNGSRVLVLCVNGNTNSGYIIGGVPHPQNKIVEDDTLHLNFEFNGLNASVNADGEFTLLHKGATDAKGDIKDDTGTGSYLKFVKDGNIEIGYQDDTSLPFITLNKGDKKLTLSADSDIAVNTKAKVLVKTTSGFIINDGGILPQALLKATLYRQQQTVLHNMLKSSLQTLTTLCATAGASITAAATAVPAGAVAFTGAGTALTAMGPLFAAMQAAIAAFDALSDQYLSQKHKFSEDPIL